MNYVERNKIAYDLRKQGLMIKEIGEKLNISPSCAYYAIREHCRINNLERPFQGGLPKNTPVVLSDFSVKSHGEKWHKMHCGKGLRSPDIASIEGCGLETVRGILYDYRQSKWG